MPRDRLQFLNELAALFGEASYEPTSPRHLSLRVGLGVALPAGFILFVLSRYNYLLYHTLAELTSVVLAIAVFLIGWNTRGLAKNQVFMILASGLLVGASADLLHTLAYKGMNIFPVSGADLATQLWIVARYLSGVTFLFATLSLGRRWGFPACFWLFSFAGMALLLLLLIWPFALFPACLVEGEGLTPFKILSEYTVILMLLMAVVVLWQRRKVLSPWLVKLLLCALLFNIVSGLSFTLYTDVYGFTNFLGHYFKLIAVVLVYYALVDGTLRAPYDTLFRELTNSFRDLNEELHLREMVEEQQRISNRELSLLYRVSRALHSTLNLDELTHLILSAATAVDGGGFERAMLFTVNERTGVLQGMLGVSCETSQLILPQREDGLAWEQPKLGRAARDAQRQAEVNRAVIKQRLLLDATDNALAKAFHEHKVVLVPNPADQPSGGQAFADELGLGPYACAPLPGRNQAVGVLLVDNPTSGESISEEREHFLELFVTQAGLALDNAGLVHRLEQAHQDLRDVQERLIQGEKLAVLGEMSAQVAHELKNPLVSIGGFARRLARRELGDPKANEYAEIIAREVRRMEEMLGNILAFSKKQLVCLEVCDLETVFKEALDLEKEHCQRQGVDIIKEVQEPLPVVIGDCRQIRQVVHNLLINARQAMPEGGRVFLRAGAAILRGDEAVAFEVEDSGGGISPDVMRNIFNPFFSTQAKGTGLGLSISHRIIEQHHGEVEVLNGEEGARFIVRLPVRPPGIPVR